MSKIFKLAIGLLVMAGMAWPAAAALPGTSTLKGQVPAVVSQLTSFGRLDANTNLQLAIGLPLRNHEALTNLLQQISDPNSPNYRHYLTVEEFTAQFGPTEQDYQKVQDYMTAHGLKVSGTHPNRMVLDVTGKASDVEQAFNVTLHKYHHPTEARDFYAPDVDPSIPSNLSIQNIGGLDNFRRPYSRLKFKPGIRIAKKAASTTAIANATVSKATTGSGPDGDYIGNDFRTAYVPGTTLNGSGQTIALVQFDGYLASDIVEYEGLAGRTNVPLQNVLIDGFSGSPTGNGGEVEVSLDIEMSISMAPALSKIILYEGNPDNFFPNDVLNKIATDNSARQISCSWGWTGGPNNTTDQIFQEMILQGQTFYDAEGDSCAFTAGVNSINGVDNPFIPNAPSDSPYITQVGGTTLTMSGSGAAYSSETVWNWGTRYGPSEDGVGGSGGISSFYAIPTWQTNASVTSAQGSATFRNMPDVALTADDVLVIADGGLEYIGVGGTSCASPLWAGFTALINQQALINGHATMGFINPALYALAATAQYTNYFNDITTGNNEWSQSPSLFSAKTGYDLCSGLGSPKGTALINALTSSGSPAPQALVVSAPHSPWGPDLTVMDGSNPNGLWLLFVRDDLPLNIGSISNGWSVAITSANPVGYAADNQVYVTPAVANANVGANWTVTIAVTNYGPSVSSNVLVTETFPLIPGISLVGNTPSIGSVSELGNNLYWNISTLANNAGGTLLLTFNATSTGVYTNSAIVTADTSDPNSDDNQAGSLVTVGTVTAPVLSGSMSAGGGHFTFQVDSNPGTTNVIQASTNLMSWIPVYTNVSPFSFTDLNTTNVPYRFYRAIMVP